jgi:type II secretory pathway component PulM
MIGLRPREKRLAIGMASVIAALSLYGFVIAPRMDRIRTLQRVIPEKQQELRDLTAKSRQVMMLSSQLAVIRQAIDAAPAVEFLPALASIIERQGLRNHLATLEPQTAGSQSGLGQIVVEMSLQAVTFGQLLDFVQQVQTQVALARIGTLHLSRAQDPNLLDAALTLRKPQSTREAAQTSQDPNSR